MSLTWGDLNGKVHDKIIPTVADVVYKSSPMFIRIRTQNGQQFDGGVKIRQNIGYAELNGGAFGRGQTFNTDYVPTDTAFQVDPKFYYVLNWRPRMVTCDAESPVIKLNPEMGTDCKQATYQLPGTATLTEKRWAAVETESGEDSLSSCDSPNLREINRKRSAEMTDPSLELMSNFGAVTYCNITLYVTDDVLARGRMQAVPFVGSKIANAAGKMAKLLATDMYLDGLGTNSSTLSVDGFQQWFDNGNNFTTVGGITRTDLGVSNGRVVPF